MPEKYNIYLAELVLELIELLGQSRFVVRAQLVGLDLRLDGGGGFATLGRESKEPAGAKLYGIDS